ncbi:MAG: SDR family NAD(P)-dependent oxidoreductase [Culturomica sp.]|jgi:FlaA1/EpsC-like NDP-sugar epimerase|nr:SDR family NAD(P)-dependent oxidoreductase [Culturomica sp.]
MFTDKRIVITGGTGAFGRKFTEMTLARYPGVKEIVIFSRDAGKQQAMAKTFGKSPLRFVAGDVACFADVEKATRGADIIVHTAAVRLVSEAENDPWQAVLTNVTGAHNLIEAAVRNGCPRIVALSTDMASLANNAYGASKMLSDKLFTGAGKSHPGLKTAVIRYGNMFGSQGTVIPFFVKKAREEGVLPVTDPRMTRFMATLEACVRIAWEVIRKGLGGEIFAPRLKSYNILTVARAVDPGAEIRITGLRPGEKLYEEMITRYDSYHTLETGEFYIIVPPYADMELYRRHHSAQQVAPDFEFNSENCTERFSEEEIRCLIGMG